MAARQIDSQHRVYLDNAATSWPKSQKVLDASSEFLRECGATAGRGVYSSAQAADRWLQKARQTLATVIAAPRSSDIAMCSSGTHALNAILWGLLSPGDHVVTCATEHNSVLRPLHQIAERIGIEFDVAPTPTGRAIIESVAGLLRPNTKMIVVGHASNVTGATTDLSAFGVLAQDREIPLVVDASQTLGYLPIDVQQLNITALAAAAHKGLRALPGTGMLYLNATEQARLRPMLFGGTGRASERIDDVPVWPHSVEVGNLNMSGVVSMAVAAEEVIALSASQSAIWDSWLPSFERLVSGLQSLPGIRILGAHDFSSVEPDFVPVVSLHIDGWDVHDFAAVLDSSFQIEARAGWHCAAKIHEQIGVSESGGTLRLSTGHSTSIDDIEYTLRAFQEILG